MSASGHIIQMVRAHFSRDDQAFASAALTLARAAKAPQVRASIIGIIQSGARNAQQGPPRSFQPLPQSKARSTLLEPLTRVTFEDLLANPVIQAQLDEIALELEYRNDIAERGLRARNRLLFYGEPGNGKTVHAAALATALDIPAFGVALPALVSKYMGETGTNMAQLFNEMRDDCLVVFDELDAVASERGRVDQAAAKDANSTVNVMLTLMDRVKTGVMVATTNRKDIIDPALLRRFDEVIEFPEPSAAQMNALRDKLCDRYSIPSVDVRGCRNFDEVAKRCETEARRAVMREILAAEEAAETEDDDGCETEETESERRKEA